MDWKEQTLPLLDELRRMIKRSDFSQRQVELRAGFSKGYLSQLLAQNLDLKVWHILAILDVFEQSPSEFFERLYPTARPSALEAFRQNSEPLSDDIDSALSHLYTAGVESLNDLRRRLDRCEQAVEQLEHRGLVQLERASES